MKRELYFDLLKEWCDRLISLQITEIKEKELYGGILCPSCARIHGRCADAIYPLMFLADRLGDSKYSDSAKLLFDWSENMARPGGFYINDTNSTWTGITVFASIALGEALYYHGHILDEETKTKWSTRLKLASDYLYANDFSGKTNINYPITCAASMAVSYNVLGDEKYKIKARKLAHDALHFFTPEGLIFGEGKPSDIITPKGCRAVDLGYNVEESLGGLVTYGLLMNDEEVLSAIEQPLHAHLAFMLPDGAWDNSWGSRSNKWTYWGSRTSDGCQIAYGLMAHRSPLFEEAAYRNALLLEECTSDGLLHGGPMYTSANEPPCSHHTFCHAKALTAVLEHEEEEAPRCLLPRENLQGSGLTYYPSIHTLLLHAGSYRATITGYDYDYVLNGHATGGTMSLLWHEKTGAVLAATMTEYSLVEVNNMQMPQYFENISLTPRIELKKGEAYRSCNNQQAEMTWEQKDGTLHVKAAGNLRDAKQQPGGLYEITYSLHAEKIEFEVASDAEESIFILPVIAKSSDVLTQTDDKNIQIKRDSATISVSADSELFILTTDRQRVFNPVGGFEAVPVFVKLDRKVKLSITIQ